MVRTLGKIKDWFSRRRSAPPEPALTPPTRLLQRYQHYKRLLAANSAILTILADLQTKKSEGFLFDMAYVRGAVQRLEEEVATLVDALVALSGGRYAGLETARQQIAALLRQELAPPEITPGPLALPLAHVTEGRFFGGKAEKAGELARCGLPVPPGFAVSAYAQKVYFEQTGLADFVRQTIEGMDIGNMESLRRTGRIVRERLMSTPLPTELSRTLREQASRLGAPRVAVRSSALQEDGLVSFAGQFDSILNVPPEEVEKHYQEVLASQFTPRALYYCHTSGFLYQELAMGVLVMAMVDPVSAGAMYTADPREGSEAVIINAVWGLGTTAVGGDAAPDIYRVEGGRIVSRTIGDKSRLQLLAPEGGVVERQGDADTTSACLSEEQILELAALGRTVARHFGVPQDIEWACDRQGRFILLQARPLKILRQEKGTYHPPRLKGAEVILENGAIASRGAGAGPIFVHQGEPLEAIPQGSVLVTHRASPEYGLAVGRMAAMISEGGSATSHLATVLREAGVPALFGVKDASGRLTPGAVVTVDAYYGNVYAGRQEELLKPLPGDSLVRQSRAYQTLERVLRHITPLNLLDPRAKNFQPQFCRTYHDITRFSHEKAMTELFQVSRGALSRDGARQLKSHLPLEIFLVDLGGGLAPEAVEKAVVTPEEITSRPMLAYWQGMSAIGWKGPRPMDLAGFMSVVMGAASDTNPTDRLQEENYAIIAGDYLNFSSRLGYHFTTVDAYFGAPEESYITLTFYGGGADLNRRVRRVLFLAKVLEHLEFRVDLKGDSLTARLDRVDLDTLAERLEILGRLIMVSKQLDVTMDSDVLVEQYYQEFIQSGYNLQV